MHAQLQRKGMFAEAQPTSLSATHTTIGGRPDDLADDVGNNTTIQTSGTQNLRVEEDNAGSRSVRLQ